MKIFDKIEKIFLPVMTKLAENIYLKAVRNGMVQIIPLVIVGSFFLMIINLPFPGYTDFIAPYADKLVIPFRVTVYMMSIYVAFAIGGSLAEEKGINGITGGIIALIGFMMTIVPVAGDVVQAGVLSAAQDNVTLSAGDVTYSGWVLQYTYLGSAGLFGAIVTSLISVQILYLCIKYNLTIKMPAQVPKSVSNSFAALLPTAIVVILFWLITTVFNFNIHQFFNFIFSPFQDFLAGENLFGALVTVLLITILWSAGIHGVSVIGGILRPFWQTALEQNATFIAGNGAANDIPNIITEPFFQWFVWIGGAGGTAGLIIATLLVAKSSQLKAISKLSLTPTIFNINEPVIFGYPIVLNPILVLPFIIGPLVVTIVSFIAIKIGLVNAPYILASWTLPGPIGAVLATADFRAAILCIVNIIILTIIYIPFIKIYDIQLLKEEQE